MSTYLCRSNFPEKLRRRRRSIAGVSPTKPWAMRWLPHGNGVAPRRTCSSSCRPWRHQGCEALRSGGWMTRETSRILEMTRNDEESMTCRWHPEMFEHDWKHITGYIGHLRIHTPRGRPETWHSCGSWSHGLAKGIPYLHSLRLRSTSQPRLPPKERKEL